MKKLILIVFLGLGSLQLFSQTLPPVFIPIQNVAQQNPMWCWAAVTEQIVTFKKNISPKQCELVTKVVKGLSTNCCDNTAVCNTPGTMQQIQAVLNEFGIKYSAALPMTNPNALYNLLAQNHPVILFLQSSRTVGHCIVITGMEWQAQSAVPSNGEFIDPTSTSSSGQAIVYVNDPTSTYTQPLPFNTIVSLWSNAIVLN